MPTRTTAASRRGRERKDHIVEVALRAIGRDGLARLSMRSLAAEAQIPLGALGYYFESKDDLIREVFDVHLARELRRVERVVADIEQADAPAEVAALLTDFVVEGLRSPDHALVAEYEFLIEASRRRELAEISGRWQHSLTARLESAFARLGSSDAHADGRLVTAVLAGLEVDSLAPDGPSDGQVADIRQAISRVVTLLAASWRTPA